MQMKEISSRFDRIEPAKQPVNDLSTTNGSSRNSQRNSCQALSIQHGVSNDPASPNHYPSLEPKAVHSRGNQRLLSPHVRRCSPKSGSMVPFDTHIGGNPEMLILSLHECESATILIPLYLRFLHYCGLVFVSPDAGGSEGHEKPVDAIKVFSERELTKEFEKIASLLKAEQDWSVRMATMQKLEGIIVGGQEGILSFSDQYICLRCLELVV